MDFVPDTVASTSGNLTFVPDAPEGQHGATGSFSTPSVSEALFPRSMAAQNRTGGYSVGESAGAIADVYSLPGRAIAALPSLLPGSKQNYLSSLAKTQGSNFVGDILRSPATPFMFAGGAVAAPLGRTVAAALPYVGRLAGLATEGAGQGAGGYLGGLLDRASSGQTSGVGGEIAQAGADIATGAVVNPAIPMIGRGLTASVRNVGDVVFNKAPSALAAAENAAAQRVGIPLTRGEEAAAAGSKLGGGNWGAVERVIRSLPGAGGVFAKINSDKAAAAIKAVENAYGAPISTIEEGVAAKIADGIEKGYRDQKNMFAGAYQQAIEEGKSAYLDGGAIADKIEGKLSRSREMNTLVPDAEKKNIQIFLDKIRGIDIPVSKGGGIVKQPGEPGSNYEAFKDITSLVGSAKRRMEDALSVKTSGLNDTQARAAAQVYQDIYTTLKAAEYNHLRLVGGNDLVDNMKIIDRLYAEDKGSMSVVKKMFGIGSEEGQKGFVVADNALDNMLTPKNAYKLDMALKYASDDTKNQIAQAAIGKIIRASAKIENIGGKPTISQMMVEKYGQALTKYRPVLQRLISPDRLKLLDDTYTGMRRGNIGSVNLLDPSNASGTSAKLNLIGMVVEAMVHLHLLPGFLLLALKCMRQMFLPVSQRNKVFLALKELWGQELSGL
jgi:hypothetical protein